MATIEHTLGDWIASEQRVDNHGEYRELGSFGGSTWIADVRDSAKDDHILIALAPTAPHECPDPACPGNVNGRKLEAIDELLRLSKYLLAYVNAETVPAKQWRPLNDVCNELRDAVAKVEGLTNELVVTKKSPPSADVLDCEPDYLATGGG